MSIFTASRRSVKSIVHPSTPTTRRESRPFGEGLTAVEQLAHLLTPAVEQAETIPASVEQIRITSGEFAGTFTCVVDETATRWWKAEFGTRFELTNGSVDRLYRAGRVAILAETPAPAPTPIVKASSQDRLDAAWHSGFALGTDGIDATARKSWPADVQAAFLDGFSWGQEQRDADLQATADLYEAMAHADMPSHFAEMYA